MFISTQGIEKIKQAETDPMKRSIIGMPAEYYFLMDDNQSACGMPVHLLAIRPYANGESESYYADMVIPTPVEDVYSMLKNVHVVSFSIFRQDMNKEIPAMCKFGDLEGIQLAIRANERATKTHLKLVSSDT